MIVYQPASSIAIVHNPDHESEFEIQAELYSRLRIDGFEVRGNVPQTFQLGNKDTIDVIFDLIVTSGKKTLAIIEIKTKDSVPCIKFDETTQGMKYRAFGVPVILFWDMAHYQDLRAFLTGKQFKQVLNFKVVPLGSLKRLHKSLDIASMSAYDLGLKDLEQDLDDKKEQIAKKIREESAPICG